MANDPVMSKDQAETLSIRQMCDAYDVTPRTLRFYEAKELLFPIRDGTKRWFTKKDRARLTLILRGKRFGFSLEDIRQLLDMYHRDGTNEEQLVRTYALAKQRLAQMEAQRAELDLAIADLKTEMTEGEKALAAFRLQKNSAGGETK
jgi:DNA-binding transcriptional MerR regulator